MATHTDTSKLTGYNPGSYPSLGGEQRFIAGELQSIAKALASIATVLKLFEARMNTNGLS